MVQNLSLLFEVLQGISIACPDGYTVDAKTLQPITDGYAVAVAETQNSFDNAGLVRVIDYVNKHPEINAFGGWYNSENKKYYYDATIVVNDLDQAIALGKANKQIAIFNLRTLEEIRL